MAPGKQTLTQALRTRRDARDEESYKGTAVTPEAGEAEPTTMIGGTEGGLGGGVLQRKLRHPAAAAQAGAASSEGVHAAAEEGLRGGSGPLPFADAIQRSFGHHDVSGVQAHVGPQASEGARAMGAEAYATGNHVAFDGSPSLHTAAHEAAHVVQQQGGVQLKGGVGEEGDAYERHADAVADKVVKGESAQALLDTIATAGAPAARGPVQRKLRGELEKLTFEGLRAKLEEEKKIKLSELQFTKLQRDHEEYSTLDQIVDALNLMEQDHAKEPALGSAQGAPQAPPLGPALEPRKNNITDPSDKRNESIAFDDLEFEEVGGEWRVRHGPVIGLPGVSYMGPTRPLREGKDAEDPVGALFNNDYNNNNKSEEIGGKPVYRGALEVEIQQQGEKLPCVRLYLTVVTAQNLTNINESAGYAASRFKDVQQTASGTILISTGGLTDDLATSEPTDQTIYINAGRPLRALKWAAKYIVEHEKTAEDHAVKARRLREEVKGLDPNDKQRREKLESAAQQEDDQAANLRNPLIRSFLIPLDMFQKIVSSAVHQDDKTDFPDAPENSDQQAAPNQYGFSAEHMKLIRSNAVGGSLVTYVADPERLQGSGKQTSSGTIAPMRTLERRLGVPEAPLNEPLWTQNKKFRGHEDEGKMAADLTLHYGTWLQSTTNKTNVFLEGKAARIPFGKRLETLNQFLGKYKINPSDEGAVKRFMDNVVEPWASLGRASHIVGEDYDRLKDDTEVGATSSPKTNDFGWRRENAKTEREKQKTTGSQIDKLVEENATPATILDALITNHPELKRFYAETSNPHQYRFYEHAQLVLQKYLRIIRMRGNEKDDRVLPPSALVKAILFHDMHKWSSRWQYGPKGKDNKKRTNALDEGAAEHVLPVQTMKRYEALWGDPKSEQHARAARLIVDSDPFGEFLKRQISADEAFLKIARIAQKSGFAIKQYPQFYRELHQYYQADFSSYTSTGTYVPWGDRKHSKNNNSNNNNNNSHPGTKSRSILDKYFEMDEGNLMVSSSDERRFQYKPDSEQLLATLDEKFKSPETVQENLDKLDLQADAPKGKGADKRRPENASGSDENPWPNMFETSDDEFLLPNLFDSSDD